LPQASILGPVAAAWGILQKDTSGLSTRPGDLFTTTIFGGHFHIGWAKFNSLSALDYPGIYWQIHGGGRIGRDLTEVLFMAWPMLVVAVVVCLAWNIPRDKTGS
jgi:hypothetical protein